ncbi:MAG: hypothetical protein U5L01_06955 [Rheinheimera sp.]|nr:hypothetical protein [Rheinheimera sp.]
MLARQFQRLKRSKPIDARKAPDTQDNSSLAALTADQKSIADQIGMSHAEMAKSLGV